jgi:type III secretion protein C
MTSLIPRASLLAAVLILTASALTARTAHAAEPEWPDRALTLQAQEQPLADFLRELLGAAGLRASPSDAVRGRISGRFSDSPEKIFNSIVKAYDLLPYYDGAVMHVSASSEIRSESVRARPAEIDRFMRTLASRRLPDRYQNVQALREEGLVKLRGAPEFVADMKQLIAAQRVPERAPVPAAAVAAPAPRMIAFRSFRLKFASAADQTFHQNDKEVRIPGVVSLLRAMTGGAGPLTPATGSEPQGLGRSVPSLRGQGLRRYDEKPQGEEGAGEESPPQSQEPAAADGGESISVARIEADPNLNAVLVRDYADSMRMYEELIAQLDKEPQLVEIVVTIVDVDRSKLTDLGVNWRYEDSHNSISAGGGTPAFQNGGLLLNTVLGDAGNFLLRVNALAQKGSAQVISRPQVLTLSNLEAILATDQSFFVRVAGREDVDLFDVSVGTRLRVVPAIAGEPGNPQIRLRVAIEDGALSDETVDNIPIVDRATLNTQAVIFNGQSLLLGGLVRDEKKKNVTKVPVLGDVPGVGHLFKRTTDVKSTQERLFLITPRIVTTSPAGAAPAPAAIAGPAPVSVPPAAAVPASVQRPQA